MSVEFRVLGGANQGNGGLRGHRALAAPCLEGLPAGRLVPRKAKRPRGFGEVLGRFGESPGSSGALTPQPAPYSPTGSPLRPRGDHKGGDWDFWRRAVAASGCSRRFGVEEAGQPKTEARTLCRLWRSNFASRSSEVRAEGAVSRAEPRGALNSGNFSRRLGGGACLGSSLPKILPPQK